MLTLRDIVKELAGLTHSVIRNAQHWNGDISQPDALNMIRVILDAIDALEKPADAEQDPETEKVIENA